VRPPDENQANPTHPHLRPDLMSSTRRGGNEDSILAKLEREPARRAAAGGSGIRLAWYGGAVVVALALTCTLAWLAAGQEGLPRVEVAHAGHLARSMAATEEPVALAASAKIVDAAPPVPVPTVLATADLTPDPVPPLRLLKPAAVTRAPVKPTRMLAAAERSTATARVAAPVPVPARTRVPVPRQAARSAKYAAPARIPETPDSDVALISAVIYHANGHALPDPEMNPDRCAGDACRPRPTR
jgi:hypothetical protein